MSSYRVLHEDVREYPGRKRTIFCRNYSDYGGNSYYLDFPIHIFYRATLVYSPRLVFNVPCLAFAREPIKSLDDEVFMPPMGNTYTNGWICTGAETSKHKFDFLLNLFWTTMFSRDGDLGGAICKLFFSKKQWPYGDWLQDFAKYWQGITANQLLEELAALPNEVWSAGRNSFLPIKKSFKSFLDCTDIPYACEPLVGDLNL